MKKGIFTHRLWFIVFLLFIVSLSFAGLTNMDIKQKVNLPHSEPSPENLPSPVEDIPADKLTIPDLILLGARQEVKNHIRYNASYVRIDYPGSDVPSDQGACTDVIIRAFRNAGIDLQKLIHEDMQNNFELYPQIWGLDGPDSNIDHRRVPNQITFFKCYGLELSTDPRKNPDDWKWGDIVYWRFPNGEQHCGIISDRKKGNGIPLVIHNAGIAREEDCLTRWEIIGHYRYPPS